MTFYVLRTAVVLVLEPGAMFNLQKRIQGVDEDKEYLKKRISIRDQLLAQEVQDLDKIFRSHPTCKIRFVNLPSFDRIEVQVRPCSGMYAGGIFVFALLVTPEYNNAPPTVKCLTPVWHPNIEVEGNVCLSILRANSMDGFGWTPARRISDVVLGLDSLFSDLIDFSDPLNTEAAKQHRDDIAGFSRKVRQYIDNYNSKPYVNSPPW